VCAAASRGKASRGKTSLRHTRTQAGLATEALLYREAGHALPVTGWSPTTHYNAGPMTMGGQPAADARASAEAHARSWAVLKLRLAP
jgi:hypothetical protein